MAYELHIERPPANHSKAIRFKEWREAVESTAGTRLAASDDIECRNPKTGEIIRIQGRHEDVEVHFVEQDAWLKVFRWKGRFASFNAPRQFPDAVWKAAASLSSLLGAEIRGDEGEAYDATTGEMI